MSNYCYSVSIEQSIDDAIETLKSVLHTHKLGIVSDVNVQSIIKDKLDEEMGAYRILGACNPVLAKQIITEVPEAGVLLPCTIVAREIGKETVFDIMDPTVVLTIEDNKVLAKVAEDADKRLKSVVSDLKAL